MGTILVMRGLEVVEEGESMSEGMVMAAGKEEFIQRCWKGGKTVVVSSGEVAVETGVD